jgi:hypothetical protein
MDERKKDKETGHWHVHSEVRKYVGDFKSEAEALAAGAKPREIVKGEGNLLANVGIAILLDKLIGAGSAQVYDNGHARMGVGTGSGPAAAADTDASFTNPVWVAMDASYPSRSGTTLTFQSTFGSAVANQAWTEWGIDNGSVATVLLNHKAPVTYGTKSSGETWVHQVTVTIS